MRLGLIMAFIFFFCFNTEAQEKSEDYSIPVVKSLLQLPQGASIGFLDKQLNRLGDRFSIALIKILREQDLKDPERIKRVLPLIRNAFAAPSIVPVADDREPKVTVLLLSYWLNEVADPSLKQDISQLLTTLKGKISNR